MVYLNCLKTKRKAKMYTFNQKLIEIDDIFNFDLSVEEVMQDLNRRYGNRSQYPTPMLDFESEDFMSINIAY